MSAKQFKITLHIQRRRSNLKLGLITRAEAIDVYQQVAEVAGAAGFVVEGVVESERQTCPNCGYLVLGASGKCTKCGTKT